MIETLTLTTSFTIAVLGLSIFASTYSSFLHNSEMAEANWHLYQSQTNALLWRKLSESYRNAAELRSCSANLCLWSILLLLIGGGLLLLFWGWFWLIPFGFSVILIILAFVIFLREKACPLIRRCFMCPIGRHLKGAKPL